VGHPDFGKTFPCRCTLKKLAEGRVDRLERYSNLGPLVRLTFENLQPCGLSDDPRLQQQHESCYQEARAFADEPTGWLVITGPSGCGKTHTAAAIANACIKRGIPVFWTIVPDFLDYLRGTFSPNSDVTYDDLFERVKNAALLILDDLGTHSSTPWAEEKLFQVLNHRFNAQLPMVVTTIFIDDLDERLQTRLRHPGLSRELKLEVGGAPAFNSIGWLNEEFMGNMRFRNFDVRGMNANKMERESLRMAFEAAQNFAESPKDWLVIIGSPGSGKTHLAAAVANRLIESRRSICAASVPELLDRLRPGSGSEGWREFSLDEVKRSPILIMDDFGVETATAWAREKLYQIINYRYNARLATLITTTDPVMESLDERLKSRLLDPMISNPVPLGAPNYRGQEKPKKRNQQKP